MKDDSVIHLHIRLLDTPFGHNVVNAWPIFIILMSIIRFSRVGSPSVRYFVTISKITTGVQLPS